MAFTDPARSWRRVYRWLLLLAMLSSCSTTHRFHYQYALIEPSSAPSGIIEDDSVRVRLTPTSDVGVVRLAVANKTPQPMAIIWSQSYYLDPFGRARQAIATGGQGIVHSPGWFGDDARIPPGAEARATVRPGGSRTAQTASTWYTPGPADTRVPRDAELQTPTYTGGRVTLNPFVVTRYQDGEVVLSSAPPPLLPTTGDNPAVAQAYQGREFRLILALRQRTGITPYTFTFRITEVDVR